MKDINSAGKRFMNRVLSYYLTAVNVIALIAYGIDKSRAIRHRWRIPEATLIGLALIGGGAGALTGMLIFHHKTRKWKFRILVPLAIVLWTGSLYMILFW